MTKQNKKGFTLIEVLVVVLIIGILTSIALPQYTKSVEKSRAMKGVAALKDILTAQQAYYTTYGKYAEDLSELDVDVPIPDGFEIAVQSISRLVIQSNKYRYTLNLYYDGLNEENYAYCFAQTTFPQAVALCQSISTGDYNHEETKKRYYIF